MCVWLPDLKYCRLSFIQKILSEEKLSLDSRKLKTRKIHRHWNDFAVKHVWPMVKNNKTIIQYLPHNEMNKGNDPHKFFFWGVAITVLPTWSGVYYKQC